MFINARQLVSALFLSLILIPAGPVRAADEDPFLWLEEVESPKSMDWVKSQNKKSIDLLTGDRRYSKFEKDVRKILTSKDRLPYPSLRNGWIYNFWQDADHVRGIWRRARPDEYAKPDPKWQVLLDIDRLNSSEKQDWVWHGASCLPPAYNDCLISLSHGGKDAQEMREFDVDRDTFVVGGFFLPDAKSEYAWLDADRLLVGTNFGPGSMTKSGYPRIVKLWTRGEPLAKAKTILEGDENDVAVSGFTSNRPEGSVTFIVRSKSFYEAKHWVLTPDLGLKEIPIPDDSRFEGVFDGRLLTVLRTEWKTEKTNFPAGALVSMPISALWDAEPANRVELIFAPDERSSISGVYASRDLVYINTLQNVKGKIFEVTRSVFGWKLTALPFPELGTPNMIAYEDFSDHLYLSYESFLTPPTLYSYEPGGAPVPVKSLPARFDAKSLVAEQFEATSADGTKIPYFLIHREGMKLDGSNPTLLYGYGGFEISMEPYYLNDTGKVWAQSGEVYVLANIRGGGEFGPKWHEAALKEHRQRAYDDFLAVAQDLIARKVTSPRRLGIMGGSNGGLLVGAALTQRPDLFHAVVCQVPLLDMMRYTKIAAGPSWVGEYGDPADPKMAEVLRKYSPYQNAKSGVKYPEVFFLTSTKDDRVGPVHARKMAARLEGFGNPVLYWENIEGGHGAAADLEERVKMKSLQFTYLFRRLVD